MEPDRWGIQFPAPTCPGGMTFHKLFSLSELGASEKNKTKQQYGAWHMVMTQEKLGAANIIMIIMIIVAFSSQDC